MAKESALYIKEAIESLGGVATLNQIYEKCPLYQKSSIRRTIQEHSSDTTTTPKYEDIFFTVNGLGSGVWGVRNYLLPIQPEVIKVETFLSPSKEATPAQRILTNFYRVSRDTALVNEIKKIVDYQCQLCELKLPLSEGKWYIEGHHIKPLGKPYNGPDIKENILIVCPNCHVKCDYKLIELGMDMIKNNRQNIQQEYLEFHNEEYRIKVETN